MITLTPEEVIERFGKLFSKRFLVMVDEDAGVAEIVEDCTIKKGPAEWDAVNRARAGGALLGITCEASTLVMRARLGEAPVKFGPADVEQGGQALEAVLVDGDEVTTRWAGIAGAGVGIAACIPQAPGVLRANYPTEEDLKVGGARVNRVEVISPRYEKIMVGIDDTDTKEKGATWALAVKSGQSAGELEGVEFLDVKLAQLCPIAPNKTTNCVGSALNFAVRPEQTDKLIEHLIGEVKGGTYSEKTAMAIWHGITLPPEIKEYGRMAKNQVVSLEEANRYAGDAGVEVIDVTGENGLGRIGALGALAWADEGIEAAALHEDPALERIK